MARHRRKTADADGDPISYLLCVWISGSTLTYRQCRPIPSPGALDLPTFLLLLLILLIICLVIVVLWFGRAKNGRALLALLALLLLLAIIILLAFGRPKTLSHPVSGLESGRAYFWKVIAEDGKGGTTDSETRRFATPAR